VLLRPLLSRFDPSLDLSALPEMEILGIEEDSRTVRRGDLFIARPGVNSNGSRFVEDAASRGAVAVITQSRIENCPLPQILVSNAALAASKLANLYHGEPGRKMRVLAVTGTNGKTTTTYLIREILRKLNFRCGMIGTVQIDDGEACVESEMTTPGAIQVADLLATMRDNVCAACAIETSSHALDQHRVAGVHFSAAGFTNLTGDHLDYHKTMDRYAAAKAKLFESLAEESVATVNADSTWTCRMTRDCKANVVRFGFNIDANYRAMDIAITSQGTNFVLRTPDGECPVFSPLIGRHNIENILCATSIVSETFGLSVHQIASALKDAQGAPGRLQAVRAGQTFAVLVDYAHTDDALRNVLTALRPLTRGKLRVLFGCGGDRDRDKRPRMGRVASDLADAIYVTSDNPRTENPHAIIDEIVSGITTDKHLVVEPDRHRAIELILNEANASDVVLIAGKGHENYQIVGTTRLHFDDVEEASRLLRGEVLKKS
jgi:UDP-N-acetylmuramoyl-L-alanyl-D-glutamate--2,6-diaminopimelate ligase